MLVESPIAAGCAFGNAHGALLLSDQWTVAIITTRYRYFLSSLGSAKKVLKTDRQTTTQIDRFGNKQCYWLNIYSENCVLMNFSVFVEIMDE